MRFGEEIAVVVVDELPLLRDAMQARLETEPDICVVGVAGTAADAVSEVERLRPDVVILAADLVNGDGIQTTALLKERVPTCDVLLLASHPDENELLSAMEAGARGYLVKTCTIEELLDATRSVARRETSIPQPMLGPFIQRLMALRRDHQATWHVVARLTRRERQVLALLAQGGNNATIANALVISPQTARTHVQNVMTKLRVHSRVAAAAFAIREGILQEAEISL